MSVFTPVSRAQLIEFLQRFNVGTLIDYKGIAAGIENTNFFVTTEDGEFVLTLFERLSHEELPFFINLMAFLAEHDIPSAHPIADHQNHYLQTLNDRPAVLVTRLHGVSPEYPSPAQCHALGSMLGRLHLAGLHYDGQRDNPRGPAWRLTAGQRLLGMLSHEEESLLKSELEYQQSQNLSRLPRGIIHADLFRDNSLFEGDRLTGLIDFYYACNDWLLYDLAVSVNDWCSTANGNLNETLLKALIRGYHSQRPLSVTEELAWPVMLRAAALRFWVSRLSDLHFPREGEITHTKDPDVYRHILLDRINKAHDCSVEMTV